jgi:hypothetical protein
MRRSRTGVAYSGRAVVRLRFCARGEGRWVLLNKRAAMRRLLPESAGPQQARGWDLGEGGGFTYGLIPTAATSWASFVPSLIHAARLQHCYFHFLRRIRTQARPAAQWRDNRAGSPIMRLAVSHSAPRTAHGRRDPRRHQSKASSSPVSLAYV